MTGADEMLAKVDQLRYGMQAKAKAAVKDGGAVFADKLTANTPVGVVLAPSGHMRDDIELDRVRWVNDEAVVDVGYSMRTGPRVHFPDSGTSRQPAQHFIQKSREVAKDPVLEAFIKHLKVGD
ncbi:hypothetical protein L248_1696 [Schleiferilactobacillus shenzhenensis LY-73]|uniref:HK97 gp10 family phage protein n=1 Tax=Schleiferilactobacillus shenzhenensis LY-73 TaxID=1231336 RepID=U4TIN4_9LACO|nr:hypothetical protein L248_1696 [Schleiferilactobacillus shenzhenensis LY-73]